MEPKDFPGNLSVGLDRTIHALKTSRRFAHGITKEDVEDEITLVNALNKNIKRAAHFVLPDHGVVFNDGLKGLQGIPLRLPFPHITVSYRDFYDDGSIRNMCALAYESEYDPETGGPVSQTYIQKGDRVIRVHVFENNKRLSEEMRGVEKIRKFAWYYEPTMITVPSEWEQSRSKMVTMSDVRGDPNDKSALPLSYIVLSSFMTKITQSNLGLEQEDAAVREMMEYASSHMANAVGAIASLCEALACSNVGYETLPPSKRLNLKKTDGIQIPRFDSYTLTINSASKAKRYENDGEETGPKRNGPREHLRRGHIRTLQSGEKVWVNACIVGNPEKGRIQKDYAVL
jgi:hypothetical protein